MDDALKEAPGTSSPARPLVNRLFVQGILDALPASVAVIDEAGQIVAVNRTWREFAAANGARDPEAFFDRNYLHVCDSAVGRDSALGMEVAAGIRSVLSGAADRYSCEYPCHGPAAERWFSLSVTPFLHDGRRFAVTVHHDMTARRMAERQVREHAAMLDALLEQVPDGITIARAPDVRIERVSAYGLERIQQSEERVSGITAERHPEAWQVYDRAGKRLLNPEELPLTRATRSGETVENEELNLRLADGGMLPILCNAGPIKDGGGKITGGIIIWRDISERKQLEEARQLLVDELNHRIKNLFAILTGAIHLSARHAPSARELADALTGRVEALATAHALIQPTAAASERPAGAALRELLQRIVAPHLSPGKRQLLLDGPDLLTGPDAVTDVALVIHELATNAAKYGALSSEDGTVSVSWSVSGADFCLEWREDNARFVSPPRERHGFGSRLIEATVTRQMDGRVEREWLPAGLRIRLHCPADVLAGSNRG